MIDAYAVGGNGGSLAIKYWDCLKFPNFPNAVEKKIARLYHNIDVQYAVSNCTLKNFIDCDNKFNQEAGIYELDKSMNYLKGKLNQAIACIADDKVVDISF